MGLFKVVYQVFIAGVVNREPIAPAPRQRIREKTKSFKFSIFTVPVYQNLVLRIQMLCGEEIKIALGKRVSQILLLTAIYLCPLLDAPVRMVITHHSEVAAGRIV